MKLNYVKIKGSLDKCLELLEGKTLKFPEARWTKLKFDTHVLVVASLGGAQYQFTIEGNHKVVSFILK